MSNSFDFELKADDQTTAVITKIDNAVRNLEPQLGKLNNKLKLGGAGTKDNLDSLNQQFGQLSKIAKENVQFIGDMVPPLKNVTGLASDYSSIMMRLGGVGVAAYATAKGVQAVAGTLTDAANSAYHLDIASKNSGMKVDEFTRLAGAMRVLGADSASANASVEKLYQTFNDAVQGRNPAVLSIMNQVGAPVIQKENGTADVPNTMLQLSSRFTNLNPAVQKTLADKLGLDANGLQLMREGVKLKELLVKSDQLGLTINPDTNEKLTQLDRQLNELSASWDGLIQRSKQHIALDMVESPKIQTKLGDLENNLNNGMDDPSFFRLLGVIDDKQESKIRRAVTRPDFWKTLTWGEQQAARRGFEFGDFEEKYQKFFKAEDDQAAADAEKKKNEIKPISVLPFSPLATNINPNARSVRNNNPGNLRYAGQPGAVRTDGDFAMFASPELGIKAADVQLQKYATGQSKNVTHPLNTVADIVKVYSPSSDNNDSPRIAQNISKELGVSPYEPINLMDPALRSRYLKAMFDQEGNNAYSADQIQTIVQSSATVDPSVKAGRVSVHVPNSNGIDPQFAQTIAEEIGRQMKDMAESSPFKMELTVINDATGQTQTFTAQAGKTTKAMITP